MSGHSKWATTKRAKAVVDAKKGAAFTKLAKAIAVAAREGGGNIDANSKLRLAVERARAASMPKDNIERAIARGTGELGGEIIESVTYEGFAPGGTAVVAQALTDNRNRTAQVVKSIFQKYGGNLGGPGSVLWMFDRRGVIRIPKLENNGIDELELIDLGAEDIIPAGDELVLLSAPDKCSELQEKLGAREIAILNAEVDYWPKTPVEFPSGADGEKLSNFLSALDDSDDVEQVSTAAVL